MSFEDPVLQKLARWADSQSSVRAMLLTSTRAIPDAPLDPFSDYDVILAVTDTGPFYEDRNWLNAFGPLLVVYRDPPSEYYGLEVFAYITQYEDGLKIDFTLWPVEILRRVVADPLLPDELDNGYRILLDKDELTAGLKRPTYNAYIPTPPTELEYQTVIEEFFHETTYVAKLLWRGELMPAKYSLDYVMKIQGLRQMLEWHIETLNDWTIKAGVLGKGLKERLEPEIWPMLESTYAGADLEENWDALGKSIILFRKVAIDVGLHLGYEYPHDLDRRMMNYLEKVRKLDRRAKKFPA